MDTYPGNFITLYIHRNDGYQTPWGDQRFSFYQVQGYPTPIFDGLEDVYYQAWAQGYPYPYTGYMPIALDNRLAIQTDVTIDVQLSGGGDTWHATAEVCIEQGGTGKDMRVHMVRVLDNYPTSATYYRDCVMEGVQMPVISLAAGECEVVEQTFVLDPTSTALPDQSAIVVFAQDVLTVWPAEIYQGAQAFGPPLAVFADGFEAGDALRWSVVTP